MRPARLLTLAIDSADAEPTEGEAEGGRQERAGRGADGGGKHVAAAPER